MPAPKSAPSSATRRQFFAATAGVVSAAATMAAPWSAAASPSPQGSNPRPLTIPALREWRGRPGTFTLGPASRIAAHHRLIDTAELFAADLSLLTGQRVPVTTGQAKPGDIQLQLGVRDDSLGDEGYRLAIDDRVLLAATTEAGAFYGTRTVLQLLAQSAAIPTGTARDWPRYPERGLMVDVARSPLSLDWIASHIRELAYLKLNYLHLHLTDDQGFRVASERHPEIVSDEHFTKDQIDEIVALAARHQITVVPEIDMPGHMGAALKPHPEFQLHNVAGVSRPPYPKLDITNPAAQAFAHELIDEFAPLFPGPYFHIGADEFMFGDSYDLYPQIEQYAKERYGPQATARDAVLDFVNECAAVAKANGKTLRTWNDGLYSDGVVDPEPGIVADCWTESVHSPQDLLDRGHRVMNAGYYPTYYVVGPNEQTNNLKNDFPASAYETWEVHRFSGEDRSHVSLVHPGESGNLGSKVHLWGDINAAAPYESEEDSAAGIVSRLRIVAQKSWRSPLLADTWSEFEPIMTAVGHAPGY